MDDAQFESDPLGGKYLDQSGQERKTMPRMQRMPRIAPGRDAAGTATSPDSLWDCPGTPRSPGQRPSPRQWRQLQLQLQPPNADFADSPQIAPRLGRARPTTSPDSLGNGLGMRWIG